MKIGYPCINRSLHCGGNSTFRLASYSPERLQQTVEANLRGLESMLEFNVNHGLLFFRVASELVPFASHPVCRYDWQRRFRADFRRIGRYVRRHGIRLSMHPDQFVVVNARDSGVFRRSVAELEYHATVMDLMELNCSHKIQIHVGGVYGDRERSLKRFARRFRGLPRLIRRRLAIENDDRCYTLAECTDLSSMIRIPVIFDMFHHSVNCSGESTGEAAKKASLTWRSRDGVPMVDYSEQRLGARAGTHAETMRIGRFRRFLEEIRPLDVDVMLEIKDKEKSALRAARAAESNRAAARRNEKHSR